MKLGSRTDSAAPFWLKRLRYDSPWKLADENNMYRGT